jgi:predicted phosphodiesterase
MDPENKPRVDKLPHQRLRNVATALLELHPLHSSPLAPLPPSASPIRIVCVSDTHNTQPDLPEGDILIHAGDLTEYGSFDEIQTQLTWLSSQPHRYKLMVAGNHELLLDEAFLRMHPERLYGEIKRMEDLEWGSVHYLCESSVTLDLEMPQNGSRDPSQPETRRLTVFGSPWTPQHGTAAFQYRRGRTEDRWAHRIPSNADIVITHGPPRYHLDGRNSHHQGCPSLGRELIRVRPRLVVFGHIHISYGREDVVLDGIQRTYEAILNDWSRWEALVWMAMRVLGARISRCLRCRKGMGKEKCTTFVNASAVGGTKHELRNRPIVVDF